MSVKIMYVEKSYILILFLLGLLAACGSDTLENVADDFELNKTDIASYKSLKKVPETANIRGNRLMISFIERNALAGVIAGENWSAKDKAEVEIKDKRNQILVSAYFKQFMDRLATPDTIDKYYQDNIEKFKDSKMRIAHILLRVHDNRDSEAAAAKFKQIRGILEEINTGASYEEMAREYSDDKQSGANGGEIGWISKDRPMDKAIYTAALKLKVGETSEPVPTDRGLHLIKLLEEPIEETPSLDQVRDKVEYQMKYDLKLKEMDRLKKLAEARVDKDLSRFDLK